MDFDFSDGIKRQHSKTPMVSAFKIDLSSDHYQDIHNKPLNNAALIKAHGKDLGSFAKSDEIVGGLSF